MEHDWTDKRMDDFAGRVDRFEASVDRRFDKVDERFDKVEARLDRWGRIVAGGVVSIAGAMIYKILGL